MKVTPQAHFWRKLLAVLLLLGLLFLALQSADLDLSQVTVASFKERIHALGIWGPVVFILLYILRPLILFPASLFSASAGVIWGLQGWIYLLIGANLSAMAEFLLARHVARDAVTRLVQGRMRGVDRAIEKRGFLTVLVIRLVPNVAWDIQNLALGLTRVRFRDYVLATAIGILPGSFALVYFGDSLIELLINPGNIWKFGVAMILFGALYVLQKKGRSKRKDVIDPAESP